MQECVSLSGTEYLLSQDALLPQAIAEDVACEESMSSDVILSDVSAVNAEDADEARTKCAIEVTISVLLVLLISAGLAGELIRSVQSNKKGEIVAFSMGLLINWVGATLFIRRLNHGYLPKDECCFLRLWRGFRGRVVAEAEVYSQGEQASDNAIQLSSTEGGLNATIVWI